MITGTDNFSIISSSIPFKEHIFAWMHEGALRLRCYHYNISKKMQFTLMVSGVSTAVVEDSTILFIRIGFVRSIEPAPLLQTISMGHPILMSMKSTLQCCSMSSTVLATVSGYAPQIWTPKKSSSEWRLSNAHSEAWP